MQKNIKYTTQCGAEHSKVSCVNRGRRGHTEEKTAESSVIKPAIYSTFISLSNINKGVENKSSTVICCAQTWDQSNIPLNSYQKGELAVSDAVFVQYV